ncbi:MAG TPA: argininosuccinate synthase, partial [Planctomycetes bacterium]|nr:argininosuccinate synthase [Planctomycetota bacterium]
NDQVRFELTYAALAPQLKVISPWKSGEFLQQFKGRTDMINFCEEQKIDIPVSLTKPYSMDENLMHKSYESGILEDPLTAPDPEMWQMTVDPRQAPDEETVIELEFKDGHPIRLTNEATGETHTDLLDIFMGLNALGRANGIGRIDIVENRF